MIAASFTDLLKETILFGQLSSAVLEDLAQKFQVEIFGSGQIIAKAGATGDRLFVVAEGKVEVLADDEVPLACLGRTALIGEIALLSVQAVRNATLKAVTKVVLISLERTQFSALLKAYPLLESQLQARAEEIEIANFLRTASPFRQLEDRHLLALGHRLKRHTISPGQRILTQGASGDSAFLLMAGTVDVHYSSDGGEDRVLSTLERGALFGEAALLTDAPRNASVDALAPCEILELKRGDLLAAMSQKGEVARCVIELLQLRQRPRKRPDFETVRIHCDGQHDYYVLKSPVPEYFKLSEEGLFIWERLDGEHDLKDLAIAYLEHFKRFAPHFIAEIISELAISGFVTMNAVRADVTAALGGSDKLPLMARVHRQFSRRWVFRNVDPFFSQLHAWLSPFLHAGLLIGLFLLSLVGLVRYMQEQVTWPATLANWSLLFAAFLVSLLLHEIAHGLAVKAQRREVHAVGIGIEGGLPFLYVDTSDMWLAQTRRARILVGFAGVYMNFVLGSLGVFLNSPAFASLSYAIAIVNLVPLFNLDGAHILSDMFERTPLKRAYVVGLTLAMVGAFALVLRHALF